MNVISRVGEWLVRVSSRLTPTSDVDYTYVMPGGHLLGCGTTLTGRGEDCSCRAFVGEKR